MMTVDDFRWLTDEARTLAESRGYNHAAFVEAVRDFERTKSGEDEDRVAVLHPTMWLTETEQRLFGLY